MKPHEQRVVDEQKELSEKLTKLQVFIASSPIFKELDERDQELLEEQQLAMLDYQEILDERISRFS